VKAAVREQRFELGSPLTITAAWVDCKKMAKRVEELGVLWYLGGFFLVPTLPTFFKDGIRC
jgi:hypothetical protein